ncbi:MAG TPA: Gfo/Idh/MocA family oxidoreductase [Tepidisphaeraceae bacterium]|nr:Gfo/Idh/MocA family oxidoreductase [Tepidisphaeraceae bacterium]
MPQTQQQQQPSRTFNVAVVGYGFAGRSFHSYLAPLAPGLNLYAIAVRDPAKQARARQERTGAIVVDSFEQVIADPAVDLVVLGTPHDTHAPLAVAALDAGKHVVTDKVMCLDLSECERMTAAARRNDRLLTVFHNRRWDGDFLTLQTLIAAGRLGEVRWVEMAWQKYGVWGGWRATIEKGGGRTFDLGAHLLDQLLLLFPEPVAHVYARMHRDWPGAPTESHATITLAFEGGRTAVCDVGSMTRWPKPRVHAIGTEATFVKHGVDPQEPAMIAGDIDAAREDPAAYGKLYTGHAKTGHEESPVPTTPGRWRCFYENVAQVLSTWGRPDAVAPAVTLDEMRRLMAVLDAAFESARTGLAVRPAHG